MPAVSEAVNRKATGRTLVIRRLGLQPYEPVWHAMQQFTDQRTDTTPDEIWLLEHPPVFTQGQAGKAEHVLAPGDIPVIQVDRGGQVTYHGPGQLIAYLLIDIARIKMGARELVTAIENALIATLGDYHIQAAARKDAPGVYVGQAKIASLGLRIRHGKSFHGLSFNLTMDLEPFNRINPCGYAGMAVTRLCDLRDNVSLADIASRLQAHLLEQFGFSDIRYEPKLPGE